MLDLSPTKLIIIFIVVIVLLGPKRLPQVARQLGSVWRKMVGFQQQVEHELRQTMPDLPSSQEIVRMVRSPVTMLNQLVKMPEESHDAMAEEFVTPPLGRDIALEESLDAPEATEGGDGVREAGLARLVVLGDDPSMN